jgi:N-acetylglucosamine kinase-like BadF-type ATPase
LGVDGGGSKVGCLAADESGRLLGYGRGGPVNTNYVPRNEAVASLGQALRECLAGAGLAGDQVEALCISAPMEPAAVDAVMRQLGIRHLVRAAEGETPRWATCFWIPGHVGVTVDAGTGSMARGWSRDGRQAGAGGWGATLGDEGSGFWIGLRAMAAVLQAHDGRLPPTKLSAAVLDHFGLSEALDLVFRADERLVRAGRDLQLGVLADSGSDSGEMEAAEGGYRFRDVSRLRLLTRSEVAGLCPLVAGLARSGDWKAVEIFREAGRELGRLAVAVIERLGMEEEEFAVMPFGGVFKAGELVLAPFWETVVATAGRARLAMPPYEPIAGAVLLALNRIGVEIGPGVLRAIKETALDFPAVRWTENRR